MNTNDETAASEPDVDNEELVDALQDEVTPETAPEVSAATEGLTSWDEPPDTAGHLVPKMPMEDEVSPGEQMVNEGLDEADRELRVAAADPDLAS